MHAFSLIQCKTNKLMFELIPARDGAMKKLLGFTIIELVIVILLLGILAVTAAPKLLNLQSDARKATLEATKGTLESAFAMFAAKTVLPSAEITTYTDHRFMMINGKLIKISDYDNYPFFHYFGSNGVANGIDALKALVAIDVSTLDDNGDGNSPLNIEFYAEQEGDFRIFPKLKDYFNDGKNYKCYLQYNVNPIKPHFTLELSDC